MTRAQRGGRFFSSIIFIIDEFSGSLGASLVRGVSLEISMGFSRVTIKVITVDLLAELY